MTGPEAVATVSAICLAFGFVHSILVTRPVKVFFSNLFGEGFVRTWYRFLYTCFSVVTLIAAVAAVRMVPDAPVYEPSQLLVIIMRFIQLAAVIFAAQAFNGIDAIEFLGVRQAMRGVSGRGGSGDMEGITQTRLVKSGVYGIVRHPLYLAGIVVMTFSPTLTRNRITVSILADLYFVFGAFIEERRYIRYFGREYLDYMKEVPRLLPGKKLFR